MEEEEDLDTKRRNAVFALFSTSITKSEDVHELDVEARWKVPTLHL